MHQSTANVNGLNPDQFETLVPDGVAKLSRNAGAAFLANIARATEGNSF